jgi:hypothetical protein
MRAPFEPAPLRNVVRRDVVGAHLGNTRILLILECGHSMREIVLSRKRIAELESERDELREALQTIADECEIEFQYAADVARGALGEG